MKNRERRAASQEERYRTYRPRQRDNKIYNLDEDDFTDINIDE